MSSTRFFSVGFVDAVEAAEIFDHFLGGEAGVKGGGGGKKADVGADFFGFLNDVVAANDGGAVSGLEDGGEHAERGGLARAVGAEQAVNLAGLAGEGDVVHGADFAAFFVLETLAQSHVFRSCGKPLGGNGNLDAHALT